MIPRTLALLLLVVPAPAQAADTRWRLRLHIFYDDGLKIEETKRTFGTEDACNRAGEKKEKQFARLQIMAPFYCLPVHQILDLGKTYT